MCAQQFAQGHSRRLPVLSSAALKSPAPLPLNFASRISRMTSVALPKPIVKPLWVLTQNCVLKKQLSTINISTVYNANRNAVANVP